MHIMEKVYIVGTCITYCFSSGVVLSIEYQDLATFSTTPHLREMGEGEGEKEGGREGGTASMHRLS